MGEAMPVLKSIIEISLTERCGNSCSYCSAKKRRDFAHVRDEERQAGKRKPREWHQSQDIDIPALKKWLSYQKEAMADIQLVVTGGEPTMHPGWIDLLEWAKDCGFKAPILFTNGHGLKDLLRSGRARELCKAILTCHGGKTQTYLHVRLLKEIGMKFLVKLLVGESSDIEKLRAYGKSLGCWVKYEGIRRLALDREKVMKEISGKNVLAGESPYFWRWNGYGDKIDRETTGYKPAQIISVIPNGEIFSCHHYGESLGNIDEPKNLENLALAPCILTSKELTLENVIGAEVRCEILHYVNLMEAAWNF
jgi:MoaA/NifB/PqqE/SkfB family radical SAM enzyme